MIKRDVNTVIGVLAQMLVLHGHDWNSFPALFDVNFNQHLFHSTAIVVRRELKNLANVEEKSYKMSIQKYSYIENPATILNVEELERKVVVFDD